MPGIIERISSVVSVEDIHAPPSRPLHVTIQGVPLVRLLVAKKADKDIELSLVNEPTLWN
jgi:hypothetical protein